MKNKGEREDKIFVYVGCYRVLRLQPREQSLPETQLAGRPVQCGQENRTQKQSLAWEELEEEIELGPCSHKEEPRKDFEDIFIATAQQKDETMD